MLRGFESDQIGVRRHLTRAALEKQVHLPGELAWRRAKKCLAERAQWKFRIKSALRVEANLSGKDRAMVETPSRHKSSGVEVGGLPPEAKWIVASRERMAHQFVPKLITQMCMPPTPP